MIFRRRSPLAAEAKKTTSATDKLVTGVVIGGAAGVLLGLFFAPDRGKENREKAAELARQGYEKSREIWEENAPRAQEFVRENAPRAKSLFGRIWGVFFGK